ncbi:MAG: YhcH/YjgK/YiaL family protein [Caldilineaceae bacterium]|nr:YhcH/YjgK/YiaL family protein [Caldilineaceae bacterium]
MIIDQLHNVQSGFYPTLLSATDASRLTQRFAKAFHFLQTADLENAAPGRVDIEGDQIFALVQEYNTKPLEQGFWEAHRKYIDIQYVVSGEEYMGYANLAQLDAGEYDAAKDFLPLHGDGSFVRLPAGMFTLFMPEDAHMPGMAVDQPQSVKKVVVKIAV